MWRTNNGLNRISAYETILNAIAFMCPANSTMEDRKNNLLILDAEISIRKE